MQIVDLDIIRGDTKTWRLEFSRNNAPIPLYGYTIYFTIKTDPNDVTPVLQKIIIPPDNAESLAGISRIILSTSDTDIDIDTYFYDMKLQDLPDYNETFSRGMISVIPSVT
jgi:hypothetical protein